MSDVTADSLIAAEIARQDRMWGRDSQSSDASDGELMQAAMAQLDALFCRQVYGDAIQAENTPIMFPEHWSGFRDYGSDIANLVVAAAYLHHEIARKLRAGEDFTRTSRNVETQPYTADQPAVIES
jgi:hypothetical protein